MNTTVLFGERSLTLVAALFHDADAADRAAKRLREDRAMRDAKVQVVSPHDPNLELKLEPEPAGIWRTLLRTHARLGVVGLVLGLLTGGVLVAAGLPAFVSAPMVATVALGVFGLFGGMLLAGLLSIRPDHEVVITAVRERTAGGDWAVVAHPTSERNASLAADELKAAGGEVVRSL
jgi:hypothetical protein